MTERNCVRSRRGVIWLIACLCSIVILQPCRSLGWAQGHRLIREWAEVRLPDWQRELIGAENPAKPLSDSKIADLLAKEGITVARRTVAKYREAMRILSSSERKVRKPR